MARSGIEGDLLISRASVLGLLRHTIEFHKVAIEKAEGERAGRIRAEAHSKLRALERMTELVAKLPATGQGGEMVQPAPPKAEWDDRTFLAIALSESKPGSRAAVQRAFTDMQKPTWLLHQEFAEQHRRKLSARETTIPPDPIQG